MRTVWIDGKAIAPEEARVSIFDRAFLYGDGLFETFRTWDGELADMDEHLARLRASAEALKLRVGAIAIPGEGERRVKVIVTRGEGGIGVPFGTLGAGRTIVIVEPLGVVAETATVAIVDWPLPRRAVVHKTLAYLDPLIARELTRDTDEAIRLDADGMVCEGAMSNVFVVEGGRVITPALGTGALAGVTRAQVIALSGAREEVVSVERLRRADEIFITSAIRGVCGVVALDSDSRAVGPVTTRLREAHAAEMRRRAQIVASRRDRG
ncbi:MAG: aminotransferase class IV [Deltaproteobacteria bacterium]|nr:aminotransferase class IV [Deltaproteobacteria bacterium]